jgi:hypothetical protein
MIVSHLFYDALVVAVGGGGGDEAAPDVRSVADKGGRRVRGQFRERDRLTFDNGDDGVAGRFAAKRRFAGEELV